jgi:cation diffusion facilitator family transporter
MNDTSTIWKNQAERKALIVSATGNLIIGVVGIIFAAVSRSQAIMLDGLFNLSYLATGLFTLKVAALVQQGDDERFPFGYAFFEPLVNGMKGVLVLGVSIMAMVGAVQALFSGGRAIAAGTAITYGIFATTACCLLALLTHRGAKRSGSPLVIADAENWLVNGAISSAVLLAFISILIIRNTSLMFLVPYIDPCLVLVVVLISMSVPVRMAWQALMELLNRTPSQKILHEVEDIVKKCMTHLPVQKLYVRVIQPGRSRMVLVHVVLPIEFQIDGVAMLDAIRSETLAKLKEAHLATALDMVFTADALWGAPAKLIAEGKDIYTEPSS